MSVIKEVNSIQNRFLVIENEISKLQETDQKYIKLIQEVNKLQLKLEDLYKIHNINRYIKWKLARDS